MSAQTDYQSNLLVIISTIRRTVRLFKQMINVIDEDDLQQKLTKFIKTHEQFATKLKFYVDVEMQIASNTPDALLQYPIDIGDLLSLSAKLEKQILDRLNETLKITLPVAVSSLLHKNYRMIESNYDYLQALSDLWE